MKPKSKLAAEAHARHPVFLWFALLLALVGLLWLADRRETKNSPGGEAGGDPNPAPVTSGLTLAPSGRVRAPRIESTETPLTDPETVREKLSQFVRQQRELASRYAAHRGVEFTPAIEAFFDAAEDNDFERLKWLYAELMEAPERSPDDSALLVLSPVFLETFGVVKVAHDWPASALLEYGRLVLDPLGPNTVYVGGTDEGRFIPTLLNATAPEPRVVLTQNAFADLTYCDYSQFRFAGRLNFFSASDSEAAFAKVVETHGRDDGTGRRVAGGERAVMAINDRLLAMLAAKNPELSFAVQESVPLESTFGTAKLTGALYEFGEPNRANLPAACDMGHAAVRFWREQFAQLEARPEVASAPMLRSAFAKLATGQASAAAARMSPEAEHLLRLAVNFAPEALEPRAQWFQLMLRQNRRDEAIRLLDEAPVANDDARAVYEGLRASIPPP